VLDIPKGSVGRGHGHGQIPHANPPPPPPRAPVSIEDLLATQNELMRVLVCNEANHGEERLQQPQQEDINSSCSNILSTHSSAFSGARDPLDVDDWLRTIESKFELLHCTEYHETPYAT
jgi:hypothetical protein